MVNFIYNGLLSIKKEILEWFAYDISQSKSIRHLNLTLDNHTNSTDIDISNIPRYFKNCKSLTGFKLSVWYVDYWNEGEEYLLNFLRNI